MPMGGVEAYKFEWNTLGQMVRAETPNRVLWNYKYDGANRRNQKFSAQSAVEVFTWNALKLLHRLTHNASRDSVSTTWCAVRSELAVALVVANTTSYLLQDQVYSDAFEVRKNFTQPRTAMSSTWHEGSTPDSGTFCGQYFDTETSLFYNLNRYYDADGRRFLSPDPAEFTGGLNEYSFVFSPVSELDPLGLANNKPD